MKKNKLELVYLRAFICVIIIVTHLLTQITLENEQMSDSSLILQYYIRNIFIFGTPSFIILSQLLTTLNYESVTINYLFSRFKYIFIPYLLIGLFYSYSQCNHLRKSRISILISLYFRLMDNNES